jgi:hypothetical protein
VGHVLEASTSLHVQANVEPLPLSPVQPVFLRGPCLTTLLLLLLLLLRRGGEHEGRVGQLVAKHGDAAVPRFHYVGVVLFHSGAAQHKVGLHRN